MATGSAPGVDRERWRGACINDRLEAWNVVFISHPNLKAFLEALQDRLKRLRAGGKPRGILLIAPPDGGKSTLAEHLVEQMPRREHREQLEDGGWVSRTVVPVISINTPNPCNPVGIANAILAALDSPFATGSRPGSQCKQAIKQIKLGRTLLVVIDNVQDIPERKGPRGVYNISGFIRDLIDEANVIVLMLGTEIAEVLLLANPQLHKRVPGPVQLGFYDVGTAEGLARCMRLQQELATHLPLADPVDLGSGRMGRGLACAGDGKVGAVHSIVEEALRLAVEDKRESLTVDDLRHAYKSIYLAYASRHDSVDPFADGFTPRRLNQPGEPHYTLAEEPKKSEGRKRK